MATTTNPTQVAKPHIGLSVPGYAVPVINERAVRVAAGIIFLLGIVAFGTALLSQSTRALQPFGMFFMFDMMLRLVIGDKWSPTIALGTLIVRAQPPQWVGASQKEFAWWLGFFLAATSCATMGLFQTPTWITFTLCSVCLTLLFLESAFGICVGCALQKRFSKQPLMYCPGGTCPVASNETSDVAPTTRPQQQQASIKQENSPH